MISTEALQDINSHIRSAKITDGPLIEELLLEGTKSGSVLPRPIEEIERVINGFVVLEDPRSRDLIACASVEIYDEAKHDFGIPGLAELRSVVSLRNGVGRLMVARALERAKIFVIKDVFATTDKPNFFTKYCGFVVEKGGSEIAWMDLDRRESMVHSGKGFSIKKAIAADIPIMIKLLSDDPENVLPISVNAIYYRLDSYYLAVSPQGQIIGCVGAFVYSASVPGGQPRMAEIRGLTVHGGYGKIEIQNALLDFSWNKFKNANVKQAFITASADRRAELIESGYFNDVPGGKQVLWWQGKPNDIM